MPKAVFPLATVLAGVVNLLFALVPLLGILLVTGHPIRPALLFLPVAILIAATFTLGAGLLLSPLAVFFYDIVEMVTVALTLGMYLTPVFYPMDIVPDEVSCGWCGSIRCARCSRCSATRSTTARSRR